MAISDVLFDALEEIEKYQSDRTGAYDGLEKEIEFVKHAMR